MSQLDDQEVVNRVHATLSYMASRTPESTRPADFLLPASLVPGKVSPAANRSRRFLFALAAAALLAIAGIGVVVTREGSNSSHVATRATTHAAASDSTTPTEWPHIDGKTLIADGHGGVAGYADSASLRPASSDDSSFNARTLVPVTRADGSLTGYFAISYGFVDLATAQAPGFDIEDLRAQKFGGCEPQIGDSSNKQKYPICGEDTSTP